ncbi:MAG: dihydroneopterin aldolase [Verrucomicrobiota bacterium]|nr:dihydroneopterin aldolase [Verrucomicrobiota bacterium]
MPDQIIIKNMAVRTRIGVPDEERRFAQDLVVTVVLFQPLKKAGRTDEIEQTTDYYGVYQKIHGLAAKKPRKLIEHFAQEIAEMILNAYSVDAVEVEIHKFILPGTSYVGVKIKRKRKK